MMQIVLVFDIDRRMFLLVYYLCFVSLVIWLDPIITKSHKWWSKYIVDVMSSFYIASHMSRFRNLFWHLHNKYVLLVSWWVVLLAFWFFTRYYDVNRWAVLEKFINHHQYQWYGYLGIILVYCIRPFFWVPVAWLSMVIGTMYDFGLGILLATIGENISASIWYGISKYFKFQIPAQYQSFFRSLDGKQSVLAVFLSRLWPVPDDINNYGRAMIGVSFVPYLIGTIVGNLVFTTINVWMGSTISDSRSQIWSTPSILRTNHELWLSIIVYIVIVTTAGRGIKHLMTYDKFNS